MSAVRFDYDDDFDPEPSPEEIAAVSRFVSSLLPSGTIARASLEEMARQADGEQP